MIPFLRSTRLPILALLLAAPWLATPEPAGAQEEVREELRESESRLERIRRERRELQEAMNRLQSQVHDVSAELSNIEERTAMSASALRELDFQRAAVAANIDSTTQRLIRTRDRITERKAVLRSRLQSIYKRGPLHAVRVLLSAESFGDLISRYKYLRMIATYDRLLVDEVEHLADELTEQERQLRQSMAQLERLQTDQMEEVAQLRALETQQQRRLDQLGERERETESRLERLRNQEQELVELIARLERDRREIERRRRVAGEPEAERTMTTGDLGSLDWPVDGRLIYRFGPERRENGVVLRWNGIGIATEPGTPVRTVQAGTVVMAAPFEGYGRSVIVSHGGGYYTLYHYLASLRVDQGQTVAAQQVIGTVGGERTPEGPHIEFQVRAPVQGGLPDAVDPLTWLRNRSEP